MAALKRTPCVGICSTTYGDLVCRGCKRFAHEIVAWNGFNDDQRGRVWQRLHELLAGAVSVHLRIIDLSLLAELALQLRVSDPAELDSRVLAFEVLRRCARREMGLAAMGLEGVTETEPTALLEAIELEYFQRSMARYEHDFRTLAQ